MGLDREAIRALWYSKTVAYNVAMAKAAGGVTAGLFLCQLFYATASTTDAEGWVPYTAKAMEEDTGLTVYEQETARRLLRERGIVQEERRGIPAKLYYRIDEEALVQALTNPAPKPVRTRFGKNPNLDTVKQPNLQGENGESLLEVLDVSRILADESAGPDNNSMGGVLLPGGDPVETPPDKEFQPLEGPPRKPPAPTPKKPRTHWQMFLKLVEATGWDAELKKGRLHREAKEISGAGYTPEHIDIFLEWWYAVDWRGRRGDKPSPEHIRQAIPTALRWAMERQKKNQLQLQDPRFG